MITVKLLGGAKKAFGLEKFEIDLDNVTLSKLIDYLWSVKPADTLELDTKNILIAVNGADSSALKGQNTVLHSGDVVSIIPVIHGGGRLCFKVDSKNAELFCIKNQKGKNYDFLTLLRKKFPALVMEGVSPKTITGILHAKKILAQTIYAKKHRLLLAKKTETDILLRFAATTQISGAINAVGIEKLDEFVIIALGNKSALDKIHNHLCPNLTSIDLSKNSKYLQKLFGITKRHLGAVESKNPLEDLLAEKAATLFQ